MKSRDHLFRRESRMYQKSKDMLQDMQIPYLIYLKQKIGFKDVTALNFEPAQSLRVQKWEPSQKKHMLSRLTAFEDFYPTWWLFEYL